MFQIVNQKGRKIITNSRRLTSYSRVNPQERKRGDESREQEKPDNIFLVTRIYIFHSS